MNEAHTAPTTVLLIAEQRFDVLLGQVLAGYPNRREYVAWFDAKSQRDRHLLAVQGLYSQVCNGGFAQWINNGYAEQDALTLQLARMLPLYPRVQEVQALVDRALAVREADDGTPYLSDEAHDQLDPLDDAFFALSDGFADVFHRYLLVWN
ncbi:DMP19 family protein [Deinococcus hopiensis]|nr:DUF4375 domain-containing protein [Deinococcus hopiensis]